MHFDVHGQVNRWGDRSEAALALAGVTVLLALGYLLLSSMARGHAPDSPSWRGLRIGRIVVLTMIGLIAVLTSEMVFGADLGGRGRVRVATLALIFLVVGALIGKAAPNPVVGVRTYWSLKSRLAWDKSNRLAGRLFFWIGLCGLIAAPIAPPAEATTALMTAVLGAAGLAVFESWRVWRTDPDRKFP